MADGLDCRLVNGPAFDAALAAVGKDLANLAAPLRDVAAITAERGAALAPKRSGALAAAHRVGGRAGPNRVSVTVATPYAAVQHWGWPGHGISRRLWLVASWRRDPTWRAKLTADIQTSIDKAAART